jgi:hypothetical protein
MSGGRGGEAGEQGASKPEGGTEGEARGERREGGRS